MGIAVPSWSKNAEDLMKGPFCWHSEGYTVPVHLSTGQLVSVICTYCDEELPAGFMRRHDHLPKFYESGEFGRWAATFR